MNILKILILLLSFSNLLNAQNTIKVLWIGNSYTYGNNLPNLTKSIANSTGDNIIFDSSTPGGHRLMNHTSNSTTINKIFSNQWDYVTIQAQSQEPSWGDAQVNSEVFPFAKQLCDSIYKNNLCTQPVFYMTWGRKHGDVPNSIYYDWLKTYEGMDSVLQRNYTIMAENNDALVSPVAKVWRYIREKHPHIELYTADNSHPSIHGSYAATLSFYTTFFKKNPLNVSYNYTINKSDAELIKKAVKEVVYNNIDVTNISNKNEYILDTFHNCNSYEYNQDIFYSDTILFDTLVNQAINGCNKIHLKQFFIHKDYSMLMNDTTLAEGDTLILGKDTIFSSGTHVLNYNSIYGCDSTVSIKVNFDPVNSISSGTSYNNKIKIVPNPNNGFFKIENLENKAVRTISIYSIQGKLIHSSKSNQINISNQKNGIYYLKVKTFKNEFSYIIKKGTL